MGNDFLGLRTTQSLLNKLMEPHKPSPAEILEQRISFVYGSIKPSTGVTREQVRRVILEQNGGGAGTGA